MAVLPWYKTVFPVSANESLMSVLKPGFHMVVTVVKIESRSFSSTEIQHFRTENTRSDYKLAVEKDSFYDHKETRLNRPISLKYT